jgi:tetratricopeptide (TPR) repeat protein
MDALRALAAIAIERKDHGRAWELLQKITALGEKPVELFYNLGLLLQSTGDQQKAAECYRIALEKKPDLSEALLNLGHALKAVGKDEEAKQVWSKAVNADPALAERYFH